MPEITIPGEPYTKITDVLNDAQEHRYFFINNIEVDYRYVMTSYVIDLLDLLPTGRLRRPRSWMVTV